ncbi:MAG: FAD-dependent oxidoreductase, partial [Acetobacteraceae bacterium]|nr:FAD-dependent oxidoreductase [Acetobacteraceae bacterium]
MIVGAGPAGVRAAEVLARFGLAPIVLDEAERAGGQIYRRPPEGFSRPARALYGTEAAKATGVHRAFDAILPRIDHRRRTSVWNIRPDRLFTLHEGRFGEIPFRQVILATGAMDRVIPLPGWTLPGVYSMGGAQIALKAQGTAIGANVAFIGSGPLLWLCALQYAKAGARVAAVIDATPFSTKAQAIKGLRHDPGTLAKGMMLVAAVRARGIAAYEGAVPVAIEGSTRPEAVRFRHRGRERRIVCDAVAVGYGVKPEAQLAELAGVPMVFDPVQHNTVPEHDGAGRTRVPGVYLAGDCGGIAGADAAELAGSRAAFALLGDRGIATDRQVVAALDARIARMRKFRAALDAAFPFPARLAAAVPDETILCRCETITAGELRRAGREGPAPELNR